MSRWHRIGSAIRNNSASLDSEARRPGARLPRVKLRRTAAALAAGLIAVLIIAALGALLGPTWQPQPFTSSLTLESSETTIGGAVPTSPVGTYEVRDYVTTIDVAPGVSERVKVRVPIGAGDSLPATVFLHGAGTADYLGFPGQADALASAGIVTVVADKRLDTYSVASRDYVASAADYAHGITLAASLPEVDPGKIGIYGESEGAYIAPVLAADNPDVAFVVLVSAPVVPPRSQGAFAVHNYLAATGVPQDVFRLIPRALGADIPFGWVDYVDFDPQPYQQRITQPTLVVFGTADNSMPQAQGAEQVIADLAVAGNEAVTVRFYDGANHGIRIGDGHGPLAPGFADDLARWINGLPETGTAAPRVAGAEPQQTILAERPAAPPALLSGNLLVVSHVLPVLVLLGGAVTAAVAGVRYVGRRRAGQAVAPIPQLAILLGLAAVLSVATWYVWISYVADIADLALSYEQDPDVSFGGYRAENQVAIAAAFTFGAALAAWWYRARDGQRFSRLGRAAAVMVALGTLGLLVLASYWSGFPTFGWGTCASCVPVP